ncbi:hypothetical protein BDQ17DRAFT_1229107 [Cyathus striatus]|nr:hypothetical protein BDQ17DRAFT_1229107 [Cyathus striatus]
MNLKYFGYCVPRARSSNRVRLGTIIRCSFATVGPSIIVQPPPEPVSSIPISPSTPCSIDHRLIEALNHSPVTFLQDIIYQFEQNSGAILTVPLPYESRPSESRKLNFSEESTSNVVLVAHCIKDGDDHKVTYCSGFALETPNTKEDESLILTCVHTLEEIRQSPLMILDTSRIHTKKTTGSFIITGAGNSLAIHPVSRVASSLPRSDLLLLSCRLPKDTVVNTLPVSPYPAQGNTSVRVHFVSHQQPEDSGWTPWIGDTWSKWVFGKIIGYRDFSGRESKPGTYDTLSHLLFTPLPTNGSSGGPIIDEESGAVVGMVIGSRMDNRVEGVRGWGIPSEAIFEVK